MVAAAEGHPGKTDLPHLLLSQRCIPYDEILVIPCEGLPHVSCQPLGLSPLVVFSLGRISARNSSASSAMCPSSSLLASLVAVPRRRSLPSFLAKFKVTCSLSSLSLFFFSVMRLLVTVWSVRLPDYDAALYCGVAATDGTQLGERDCSREKKRRHLLLPRFFASSLSSSGPSRFSAELSHIRVLENSLPSCHGTGTIYQTTGTLLSDSPPILD